MEHHLCMQREEGKRKRAFPTKEYNIRKKKCASSYASTAAEGGGEKKKGSSDYPPVSTWGGGLERKRKSLSLAEQKEKGKFFVLPLGKT